MVCISSAITLAAFWCCKSSVSVTVVKYTAAALINFHVIKIEKDSEIINLLVTVQRRVFKTKVKTQ